MRVLVVTNMYPHAGDVGFGKFVEAQVESLRAHGLTVDVEVIRGYRGAWRYAGAVAALRMRDLSAYDVIHAHYGLTGAVAALAQCRPLVVTFHGSDLYGIPAETAGHPLTTPGRVGIRLSQYAARHADAVIAVTDALARILPNDVPPDRVHVIPMGTDVDLFQPVPRDRAIKQLGLDSRKRYILFPYHPEKTVKQYPVARDAVARLQQTHPAAELLVFHSRPQAELALAMNAADALILPSLTEGSPCSVKEALASNLPIVATDVGDVRERIEGVKNCCLVKRSPDACADALGAILDTGERSDGRPRALSCSLDAVAQRVREVYGHVA